MELAHHPYALEEVLEAVSRCLGSFFRVHLQYMLLYLDAPISVLYISVFVVDITYIGGIVVCMWLWYNCLHVVIVRIAGHQGSTLSDLRKTTGFGPFKLPTRGPLQKGRDHSLPNVCLRSPALLVFLNF